MRYSQIKQALREAEIIDEVSMSPTSLEKFANSPEAEGMLMGIEFEMCVPNTSGGDDGYEQEPDYDANQSAGSIDEIINFFSEGDYSNMGRSTADRLRSEMWDLYLDWSYETIDRNIDDSDLDSRIRSRLEDEVDRGEMSDLAHLQWVEDNPNKDPNSEEASAEIRELTLDLIEKTVDDMMEDTQSSEYQYAYDEARQEIVDEMRNDSDYDQEAWLTDIGVDDMQDAERYWGLDWPYYTENYNGGENDVDQVAEAFTEATGYQAHGYNNYHAASRTDQQQGGYFIIEPDGSIDADQGDAGLEFISPAMPLKDGIEMLEKVKTWAKGYGCYTNKSTGLHMNISVPNMTIDNLDYVKLALFLGDEHVLKEFDRTYNSYAKSAMKIVREKIEQNPENATALLAKMKEHVNAAASKLVHSGITNKYTSINTKDKYVEFRGPGGNYLNDDIPKLINTALRAAQALRIATDDGAYKQEYAKKLYKLISPEGEWTDPNNSVALFSRYALGQINKSELVDNVRQAQVARKEKKGEEQQYWVMNKDGSGGKQMVFATSETEAIIKGGKQMGMKREDSISKLKAELFVDHNLKRKVYDENVRAAVDGLPMRWSEWAKNIPGHSKDTLNSIVDSITRGRYGDTFTTEQEDLLKTLVYDELKFRDNTGTRDVTDLKLVFGANGDNTPAPDSVSQSWKDWVEETLPTVTVDTINTVRQRIINGGDQLSGPASAWIIGQIDRELRSRMDQGVVDGNETRWKVTLDIWENTAYRNVEPVYVDADSPRQAKVKAKELFQREAGLDVPLIHMEAIATTQDAGRPEQSWIVLDGFNRPVGTVQARSNDEALRIYGSTNDVDTRNYTATPGAGNTTTTTPTTSREVFDSLPIGWQQILTQVSNLTDENLQRYVTAAPDIDANILSDEQKTFVSTALNTELRRRNNNSELAASAGNAENAVRASLPTAHREWLENITDHSDMSLINVLNNIGTTTVLNEQQAAYFRVTIRHELRRRGINPDTATPSPTETSPAASDNNTSSDYEIYNPETMQIVSTIRGGTEIYASNKALELERDLGLDAGSLRVRSAGSAEQTNESLNIIRRLAGLK